MAAILARLQVHDVQTPHEIEPTPLLRAYRQQSATLGIDIEIGSVRYGSRSAGKRRMESIVDFPA